MANLKQLKIRIKSIASTKKITKVMEMVASSQFRKARKATMDSSTYAKNLLELINIIMHSYVESDIQNLTKLEYKILHNNLDSTLNRQHLLIVLTSDRGLCGGFNNILLRSVHKDINMHLKNNEKIKLITIGKKGYSFFKKICLDNIINHYVISKVDLFCLVQNITKEVCSLLQNNDVDKCTIYFNTNVSSTTNIVCQPIVPIPIPIEPNLISYELEGNSLLDSAIRTYIEGQLYYSLQLSKTAEEFARMIAMQNATVNAQNIIEDLTLLLNRSRQANITKELNEIISGSQTV